MPSIVAPVTISATGSQTVYVGSQGTVGAVVIANESPYGIVASAGAGGQWIPAQMADRMNCDTLAFSGSITLTTNDYLSNAAQAPSYIVLITVYAPGEAIPGIYPCALARMSNIGNSSVTNTPANIFEQDLLTPFVYQGYTCAKDGSVANQLDVAAGIAFVRQSSDNSLLRIANTSTTFDTTTPSATYFLDLNPDGTWNWGTTHSGVTNHLTICSVTTDLSGNISAVTDARVTASTLLSQMTGVLTLPTIKSVVAQLALSGAEQTFIEMIATDKHTWAIQQDTAGDLVLSDLTSGNSWTYGQQGLSILPNAIFQINGQSTAGSFGVPLIVAQAVNTHVTTTGDVTILTYAVPTNGLYEIHGAAYFGNPSSESITFRAVWTDPNAAGAATAYFAYAGSGIAGATPVSLNGSEATLSPSQGIPTLPLTVYAKSGTNIIVHWNDPAGTPNDYISVLIKRLS